MFCRDNPIWRYDPDGNTDYSATVKITKGAGNTQIKTVTVDVVYAVINVSSKMVNSTQVAGADYHSETFSTSFTGKDQNGVVTTVNVVTNISYRPVENINLVRKGENVMFIVDDIEQASGEKGVSNPVGMAEFGGNVMAVEEAYIRDEGVVEHEKGHNFGFEFSNNPSDPAHSTNPSDYMHARSARGGNRSVGKTAPGVIRGVFNHFLYMTNGTFTQGSPSGNGKEKAKQFFIGNSFRYDRTKAKAAGLE